MSPQQQAGEQNAENQVQNSQEHLKPQIEAIRKNIDGLRKGATLDGVLQLIVSIAEFVLALKGRGQPQQKQGAENARPVSDIADIDPELKKSQQQLDAARKTEGELSGSVKKLEGELSLLSEDAPGREKMATDLSELRKQLADVSLTVARQIPRVTTLESEQTHRAGEVKILNDRMQTGNGPAREVTFTGGRMTIQLRQNLTDAQTKELQSIRKRFPGMFPGPANGNPLVWTPPGMFWSREGIGAQARSALFDFLAGTAAEPETKQDVVKQQGDKQQEMNKQQNEKNQELDKQQGDKKIQFVSLNNQSEQKLSVKERADMFAKLNATSETLTKATADALDAFDATPTETTYKACMDRASAERDHLENMATVLPTIMGGESLVMAMNVLNTRAETLNQIAETNAKLWSQREARQKDVSGMMKELVALTAAGNLTGAEAVVKRVEAMTNQWALADGVPATRFRRVLQGAESVIAELRARVAARAVAEEYRTTWLTQLPRSIEGAQRMIDSRQRDFDELRGHAANPIAWFSRGIARASGVSAGIEKSIAADRAHKARLETALSNLQRLSPLGAGQSPESRINAIREIMRPALTIDYSDANKILASAQATLKTTDTVIREVANWVPGGNLGIGIAEMRMNPNSPDAQRALMTGIAFAAIDLIPIPGLGTATSIAARNTLRIGARVAPRVVARVAARGTAVVIETGVKHVVQDTMKLGAEQIANEVTGTTPPSTVHPENIPEEIGKGLVSEGIGYGTRGVVRLVTRSPRLAEHSSQAVKKATGAALNNM